MKNIKFEFDSQFNNYYAKNDYWVRAEKKGVLIALVNFQNGDFNEFRHDDRLSEKTMKELLKFMKKTLNSYMDTMDNLKNIGE